MGGGRYSNSSILEAINYIERKANIKVSKILKNKNRVGDHIWYISNMKKFKKHYPNWKQQFNSKRILDELISNFLRRN